MTWVNVTSPSVALTLPPQNCDDLVCKVAEEISDQERTGFKSYLAAGSQGVAASHQDDNLPGHGLLEVLPRDDGLRPRRGLPVLPWVTGRQGGRDRRTPMGVICGDGPN